MREKVSALFRSPPALAAGHHASFPVDSRDTCDAKCPAKVQVAIDDTAAGPLGFCAHHGREIFDQMVLQGRSPAKPRQIGDVPSWT